MRKLNFTNGILKYIVVFLLSYTALGVKAQNTDTVAFADANVIVYKDARLYDLDMRPELMRKEASRPKVAAVAKHKDTSAEKELPKMKAIVKGNKTVTGSISNRPGFRVNIYNGNDKAKAMATKGAFMRAFSGTRTYMSYNVPYYKIRVGDFEDKKQAQAFMKRISGSFPGCFVVPDIVTVKNIVVQ